MLPRYLRTLRYRLFYGLLMKRGVELVTLGDESRGIQWTICPIGLSARSIVYSGGVGTDISFEHALVQRFGCEVVLLDPSPMGLKTMALGENNISQFHFLPLALAGRAGSIKAGRHPDDPASW